MRIDFGQHQRMEQGMRLSPRMIQSMEILQLTTMALEERIEQELAENPLLEMTEPDGEPDSVASMDAPPSEAADPVDSDSADVAPMVVAETDRDNAADDFQRLSDMNDQYGEMWEQNTYTSARISSDGERDAKMDAMSNTPAHTASLDEQLQDQWRYVEAPEEIKTAGAFLIGFIDDDGYIRTEMEQIARQAPPGVTPEHLQDALPMIQSRLEPAGVGARDLRESMLIQLDAQLLEEPGAEDLRIGRVIVDQHLKDLEMNRLPRIVARTGWTIEQIKAGLARLKRLDPRPGRRIAPERHQTILPDAIVEFDPVNNCYVAALNRGRTPALRINPNYQSIGQDRTQDKTTRQYINNNLQNARWLIDSIQQRNNTLLRVVRVVVDAQGDFLDHGPQHLRPLPMVQVADQLGIHVGTVSRAVSGKYIQTPRGIFPLRMFFSGGTESADGQEVSWAAVQAKLKEVIDSEDPANPWSDDDLVEQLSKKGVDIARRTIAKYRQQLNIPPARRRKRF